MRPLTGSLSFACLPTYVKLWSVIRVSSLIATGQWLKCHVREEVHTHGVVTVTLNESCARVSSAWPCCVCSLSSQKP